MAFNQYIPALVLFLALLHGGSTLKCWKCNSHDTPACGSPFDSSTLPLVECQDKTVGGVRFNYLEKTYCQWHVEMKDPNENNLYFERSCGYSSIDIRNRSPCPIIGDFSKTCYCNSGDGCNDDIEGLE